MQKMERDNFMSPDEAKHLGLIDHVLAHPPSAADEDKNQAQEKEQAIM